MNLHSGLKLLGLRLLGLGLRLHVDVWDTERRDCRETSNNALNDLIELVVDRHSLLLRSLLLLCSLLLLSSRKNANTKHKVCALSRLLDLHAGRGIHHDRSPTKTKPQGWCRRRSLLLLGLLLRLLLRWRGFDLDQVDRVLRLDVGRCESVSVLQDLTQEDQLLCGNTDAGELLQSPLELLHRCLWRHREKKLSRVDGLDLDLEHVLALDLGIDGAARAAGVAGI